MKLMLKLAVLCIVAVSTYFMFRADPSIYKRQLVLKDPAKSVQDSMNVLREICESVNDTSFMNSIIRSFDSTMVFNTESLGKFDSVSVSNKAFKDMKQADAVRLLSIMKFLNRNLISGIFHDTSIGFWLYSYGEDINYNDIYYTRAIYIWNQPSDTLRPEFNYNFKIIDRKEHMVLVAFNHNDKPFQK